MEMFFCWYKQQTAAKQCFSSECSHGRPLKIWWAGVILMRKQNTLALATLIVIIMTTYFNFVSVSLLCVVIRPVQTYGTPVFVFITKTTHIHSNLFRQIVCFAVSGAYLFCSWDVLQINCFIIQLLLAISAKLI